MNTNPPAFERWNPSIHRQNSTPSAMLTGHGRHTRQIRPFRQSMREEILSGLPADKGAASQISTTVRVLAESIASDVSLLVTFNHAIDGVIQNNPKALAQLEGYTRPLVSSLSMNLQYLGIERVAKLESLQEIIAEMHETQSPMINELSKIDNIRAQSWQVQGLSKTRPLNLHMTDCFKEDRMASLLPSLLT